ncbi:MAG: 4Fe-4S dicluster domain-containing protein [Actinobacteria bacterium]|nr:4Fe-4S dicluster domain-containing protein [Actinomycetota bacterium]
MSTASSMSACTPQPDLAQTIGRGCGANVCKCYQCKKCSNGCPVAAYADLHPSQIMRAIQLGQVDLALDEKFIWLCTGCQTCTTRCPQGIDVAAVMDELRIIARREDRIPDGAALANVLRLNADSIKRWGRLYEVELVTRSLLGNRKKMKSYVPVGRQMMAKRKIRLLPELGDRAAVKRMVSSSERIAEANPTPLERGRGRGGYSHE